MRASELDEPGFFRAIEGSGARCLLIGRRALIVLGMPVLTADYALWLHIDDIAPLNAAVERSTKDGVPLSFDDAWARRQRHSEASPSVWLPSIGWRSWASSSLGSAAVTRPRSNDSPTCAARCAP